MTPAGRGIAAFLMVAGIALFGVLTANVAAFLIEREEEADPVSDRLDEVLRRLEQLERRWRPAAEKRSAAAPERLEPPQPATEVDGDMPPAGGRSPDPRSPAADAATQAALAQPDAERPQLLRLPERQPTTISCSLRPDGATASAWE